MVIEFKIVVADQVWGQSRSDMKELYEMIEMFYIFIGK